MSPRSLFPTRHAAKAATLSLLLALPACISFGRTAQTVQPAYGDVDDRLSFGRNIPGGGEVSEAEWETFLAEVVTPAFPQGFSVVAGRGQWREASGTISHEAGYILYVTHPPDPEVDAKLERIAAEYKRRFRQEAVLRITTPAAMRFYQQ
jgi:hypothetical protein